MLVVCLQWLNTICKLYTCFYLILAAESKTLKVLLSFAVGGLLGDVFLHLLPEAWSSDFEKSANSAGGHGQYQYSFVFIISAMTCFFIQFRSCIDT